LLFDAISPLVGVDWSELGRKPLCRTDFHEVLSALTSYKTLQDKTHTQGLDRLETTRVSKALLEDAEQLLAEIKAAIKLLQTSPKLEPSSSCVLL
jgi:hypothetical protein